MSSKVTAHSRSSIRRWLHAASKLGWEPGQGAPNGSDAKSRAVREFPLRRPGSLSVAQGPQLIDLFRGEGIHLGR